jgi:hypothetical protein
MGCGLTKGEGKKNDIKFSKTNIESVDKFFDQVSETVKDFKKITDGLGKKKEDYFESSGFLYVPGASK